MKTKKSDRKALESKRAIFFELGLIVVLAGVLLAFEWRQPGYGKSDLFERWDSFVPEDMAEITVHKKPLKEPPPPPQKIESLLNEVKNDQKDDDIRINVELTKDVVNDTAMWEPEPDPEPDPDSDIIFTVVEEMPSFRGGEAALFDFLGKNLVYPRQARDAGIDGKVYVSFVVFEDGSVGNVEVARSVIGSLDEEAARVISIMPDWNPGKQRGVPVKVRYVMPIVFEIK